MREERRPYSEADIKNAIGAGRIAKECLEYGAGLVKKGALLLDVSDKIEAKIAKMGGVPAFPAQLSFNMTAAHNCADPDDKTAFEDDIVKIDVGVHVGGAVADNAMTVDLSGKWADLVKASKEACHAAEKVLGPGVKVCDVGREIDSVISSFGYKSIRNLCGHGVGLFSIHQDPTIPNYDNEDDTELEEGMFIAVEPFATPGAGLVAETERSNIFMFRERRPVRSPYAKDLLKEVEQRQELPFTSRWYSPKFGSAKLNLGLKELLACGAIKAYPPLNEVSKAVVSQHENTFLITANGAKMTTKY